MKRIFSTLFFLFLPISLQGQNLIIRHSLKDISIVCGNSRIKIEVENSSANILSTVQFQLIIPSGTSYIQGSAIITTEINISIPHQPTFTLSPMHFRRMGTN